MARVPQGGAGGNVAQLAGFTTMILRFVFLLCHEAGVASTSRAAQFAPPFTATRTDGAEFSPAHVHVLHFVALVIDDLLPRPTPIDCF